MESTTTTPTPSRALSRPGRARSWRRLAAAAVVVTLGLTACIVTTTRRPDGIPQGQDYGTLRATASGAYLVTYEPSVRPVPVNRLHSWTLSVHAPDGTAVTGANLHVDGDMLQHGHGMPTTPVVTGEIAPGTYLVDGMKFQMGGWWVVDVTVDGPAGVEAARFNLLLAR